MYSDYVSSFEELLSKNSSTTIHQKILRVVAVEMYKISHKMSPTFKEDLVTDIDTKYHTRFCYEVELVENGNATCSKNRTTTLKRIILIRWIAIIQLARAKGLGTDSQ